MPACTNSVGREDAEANETRRSPDWYRRRMFDERRIRKNGLSGTATVVSMERHSHISSNSYQRYDYVLDVQPADGAPFRTEMHETFAILASKPEHYDVVNVKYDAKSQETIFDFKGDPRYDIDAMRARTDKMREETAQMKAAMAERGVTTGMPFSFPAGAVVVDMTKISDMANAASTTSAAVDPVAAIERLVALRDAGALTPEEFETMKAKLIGP
jgi:hypothetical protein